MTERFELLERVGRGGMGVVWKARDTESGDIVALKLVYEQFAEDPDYVARFEREVEFAQRIDSAHVVKVLGYGRRAGVPFMAMEYVEGRSLRDVVKERGALPWDEVRPIALQLAEALGAAHAAGIIHRDIKPSNAIVTADGTVKLADFGIARAIDQTRMTGSATMLGTPMYMSPDAELDERSDLYSLGCVLYELLAGVAPFVGDSMQQVVLAHLVTAPDLTRLPSTAAGLVGSLLEKDRGRRPISAKAFASALSNDGRPSPPTARSHETGTTRGNRSRRMALGSVGLAIVVAGLVLGRWTLLGGGTADRVTDAHRAEDYDQTPTPGRLLVLDATTLDATAGSTSVDATTAEGETAIEVSTVQPTSEATASGPTASSETSPTPTATPAPRATETPTAPASPATNSPTPQEPLPTPTATPSEPPKQVVNAPRNLAVRYLKCFYPPSYVSPSCQGGGVFELVVSWDDNSTVEAGIQFYSPELPVLSNFIVSGTEGIGRRTHSFWPVPEVPSVCVSARAYTANFPGAAPQVAIAWSDMSDTACALLTIDPAAPK